LTTLPLDDESGETPLASPKEVLESNGQLLAVKELGVARGIWLGVRDGIRNYLITAA